MPASVMSLLLFILCLLVIAYSILLDSEVAKDDLFGFSDLNSNFMHWIRQHKRIGIPDYFNRLIEPSDDTVIKPCIETEEVQCGQLESSYKTTSFRAELNTFMLGPNSLDNEHLLIGAWVNIDRIDGIKQKTESHNIIRTILSNKGSGCEASTRNDGIAVYVAENKGAAVNDHQKVFVEFGGKASGCHRMYSKNISLEANRWHHVAVHATSKVTSLYIDGAEVNTVMHDVGHEVQRSLPLAVGAFDRNGSHPLFGHIRHIAVLHGIGAFGRNISQLLASLRSADVKGIGAVHTTPGMYAFYPLAESLLLGSITSPKLTKKTDPAQWNHLTSSRLSQFDMAEDIIGHKNGSYRVPTGRHGEEHTARFKVFPGINFVLNDGLFGTREQQPVTKEMEFESDDRARLRREIVKNGMQHAWAGYKKYAWGKDEVKPLSKRGIDNFGGLGVTLVDSLDTLWLMGMKKEFYEARDWVADKLSYNRTGAVSVFETTIRTLGGLLSAYELSGDDLFLLKARELADKLLPAFNTHTGIPAGHINFRKGSTQGISCFSDCNASLAEIGSLQVEFRYLSHHTKDLKYAVTSMRPMQMMHAKRPRHGLFPVRVSNRDGSFADSRVTFGALADSFYEYLLKVWLQGGRSEHWLRDMYDRAIDGLVKKLLLASEPSGLAFLSDLDGEHNKRTMDHLACFMPGTMALGAYTDPQGFESPRARRDLAVAKALMFTCREMYNRTATGMSAENVEFAAGAGADFKPGRNAHYFLLRPETAESLFYLHQLTGDPIYRDWAWEIWQAIDSNCRTRTAYGTARNVSVHGAGGVDDRMESFFLAETMKYLYLVQDPDTEIDLMKYVFNTEAHPLKIFDDSHIPISAQHGRFNSFM